MWSDVRPRFFKWMIGWFLEGSLNRFWGVGGPILLLEETTAIRVCCCHWGSPWSSAKVDGTYHLPPCYVLFSLLLWQILSKSSRQYVTGLAICSWKCQCFAYQAFCFFPPVACNKITLRKQLNIGLWISTQAQIRQEPDVALKMLIMFVLFTNAAQSRFLHFLAFFPCWVYIHRRPFWHKLQTMRVLVLSYKKVLFVRDGPQRHGL